MDRDVLLRLTIRILDTYCNQKSVERKRSTQQITDTWKDNLRPSEMDFSQYGAIAPEFESLLKHSPELATFGYDNDNPLELRKATNATREELSLRLYKQLDLGKKVVYTDHEMPTSDGATITVRSYRPRRSEAKVTSALIYYHGGGMLIGSLDSEAAFACNLADGAETTVFHVCYRHTPEHRHPTQHNDAWDGFEWIINNASALNIDPDQICISGISAGGTLAASVTLAEVKLAHTTGRKLRLKGQILAIPALIWHDDFPWDSLKNREVCSKVQNAHMPVLPKQRYDLFATLYGAKDSSDPLHNFLGADPEILAAMPATAIIVNGADILRDEALLYASLLEKNG